MTHSYAEMTELSCPQCRQPFSAEFWLIVDTLERPDLLDCVRAGTLQEVSCPHCGCINSVDGPLLLYQSCEQPTLLFSPAEQTTAEQDEEQGSSLLSLLAESLGIAWKDEWLEEVINVPRRLLIIALGQTSGEQEDRSAATVLQFLPTLESFLATPFWTAAQHMVEAHPELLSSAVDALIAMMIRAAKLEENSAVVNALLEQRSLLQRCRELGIAVAFAEQMSHNVNQNPAIPSQLHTILGELLQSTAPTDLPHHIELCRQALNLLDRDTHPELWAILQGELALSLVNNPQGSHAENVEQAIAHHHLALEVRDRARYPAEWAATHNNLGLAYRTRVYDDRAQNIELAIQHYQEALEVYTLQAFPEEWAMVHNNLGSAYRHRIEGERAENLEQALAYYQQALTVYKAQAFPVEWAATQNNLAAAYWDRISGELKTNIEQAIHYYQCSLEVYTRKGFPERWAAVQQNLGLAYADRITGERTENIELAIDHYQQALTVYRRTEFPADWAMTINNLGLAYMDRIAGEREENIEQAIQYYQQALVVRTYDAFPVDWAATHNNLGLAFIYRIRGDRADNVEQALDHCRQALTVRTRAAFPADWAMTLHNLAFAYANRIRGDRSENFEHAIHNYQQSLTVRTSTSLPKQWAETQNNLAIAYWERPRGERAENIEQAIYHYQQALTVYSVSSVPVLWATIQNNLANAYWARINEERAANIEEAIEHYQQSLTVYTRQSFPEQWAMIQNNLATAYSDRMSKDQAENNELALVHYQQALTVYTHLAFPERWAATQHNLATLYASRTDGERSANIEQAIHHYQLALSVYFLAVLPVEHLRTQRNIGNLCLHEQRWQEAAQAFSATLAASELLYTAAATPEARQIELREASNISSALAYALLRHNPQTDSLLQAILVLERNRARWLAESLALDSEKPVDVPTEQWQRFIESATQIRQLQAEAQLPDNAQHKRDFLTLSNLLAKTRADLSQAIAGIRIYVPEFMPTPSFTDIQAALLSPDSSEVEVGVYLLSTDQGGLALLVESDHMMSIRLDTLTDHLLLTLLGKWFEANDAFLHQRTDKARQQWHEQIDTVTGHLWTMVMGPIAGALEGFGLASGANEQPPVVTLIATGLLALLPLHAAWTEDTATPTGRHYFLDDYAVRYAPSATALSHCRNRAASVNMEQLLALDEPKPIKSAGPLPNSSREVKAISSLFPAPTVLQHEQASREATLNALAAAQVAHFSCHGTNNWRNPLESGLLLANDELLTMRDFLELHLPGARLAILSACETGIVGTDLPDEVIMLPSALVQAGYAGVIASLWSVADVSTAMLMVRFYQYWREEGLEPVYALRSAQRWVRDTTNQEKADFFFQFVTKPGFHIDSNIAAEFFNIAILSKDGPSACTFAHPSWWAAFSLTGV